MNEQLPLGFEVWCVCRVAKFHGDHQEWHFQGVFSSQQQAVDACRDDLYFIGPAKIGEPFPHEAMVWPGAYYPRLEKGPRT